MTSTEQVANDAAIKMRQAGRWTPNAVPTAQEWIVGFEALNQIQRMAIAERVLDNSRAAAACFEQNHGAALHELNGYRQGFSAVYLQLHEVLGEDIDLTEHAEHAESSECRQCGRREVAIRVGIALGLIQPSPAADGEDETAPPEPPA